MINICEAHEADYEFYYMLKCEDSSVYWSGFNSPPDSKQLLSFWKQYVVNNRERKILVLKENDIPVGYVQAVFEESAIGLSMGISEKERGKGYGKAIISLAIDYFSDYDTFFCYIREDNNASISSFKANGFNEVNVEYKQYFPVDKKEFVMRRFELHR